MKLEKIGKQPLLEMLEDRHARASTPMASQLPVSSWHGVIGEPTVADAICVRIVHGALTLINLGNWVANCMPSVPERCCPARRSGVATTSRGSGGGMRIAVPPPSGIRSASESVAQPLSERLPSPRGCVLNGTLGSPNSAHQRPFSASPTTRGVRLRDRRGRDWTRVPSSGWCSEPTAVTCQRASGQIGDSSGS